MNHFSYKQKFTCRLILISLFLSMIAPAQGMQKFKALITSKAIKTNKRLYTKGFLPDAQIHTTQGLKKIGEVSNNEEVISLQCSWFRKQKLVQRKITGLHRFSTQELIKIYLKNSENSPIITGPEQEFYIANMGWLKAKKIKAGYFLLHNKDQQVGITNIESIQLNKPITLFDISVDKDHNFCLGKDKVHAHNMEEATYNFIIWLAQESSKVPGGRIVAAALAGGLGIYLAYKNKNNKHAEIPKNDHTYPNYGYEERNEYRKIVRQKGQEHGIAYLLNFFAPDKIPVSELNVQAEYPSENPNNSFTQIQQSANTIQQNSNIEGVISGVTAKQNNDTTRKIAESIPESKLTQNSTSINSVREVETNVNLENRDINVVKPIANTNNIIKSIEGQNSDVGQSQKPLNIVQQTVTEVSQGKIDINNPIVRKLLEDYANIKKGLPKKSTIRELEIKGKTNHTLVTETFKTNVNSVPTEKTQNEVNPFENLDKKKATSQKVESIPKINGENVNGSIKSKDSDNKNTINAMQLNREVASKEQASLITKIINNPTVQKVANDMGEVAAQSLVSCVTKDFIRESPVKDAVDKTIANGVLAIYGNKEIENYKIPPFVDYLEQGFYKLELDIAKILTQKLTQKFMSQSFAKEQVDDIISVGLVISTNLILSDPSRVVSAGKAVVGAAQKTITYFAPLAPLAPYIVIPVVITGSTLALMAYMKDMPELPLSVEKYLEFTDEQRQEYLTKTIAIIQKNIYNEKIEIAEFYVKEIDEINKYLEKYKGIKIQSELFDKQFEFVENDPKIKAEKELKICLEKIPKTIFFGKIDRRLWDPKSYENDKGDCFASWGEKISEIEIRKEFAEKISEERTEQLAEHYIQNLGRDEREKFNQNMQVELTKACVNNPSPACIESIKQNEKFGKHLKHKLQEHADFIDQSEKKFFSLDEENQKALLAEKLIEINESCPLSKPDCKTKLESFKQLMELVENDATAKKDAIKFVETIGQITAEKGDEEALKYTQNVIGQKIHKAQTYCETKGTLAKCYLKHAYIERFRKQALKLSQHRINGNKTNKVNSPQSSARQSSPSPKDPKKNDDDDDDDTPYGIDRTSEGKYHHSNSKGPQNKSESHKGIKSPAPRDSQAALNRSIPVGDRQRIAIEDGEFVVFKKTGECPNTGKNIYHSYKTNWDNLPDAFRAALNKHGLTNHKGKIL